MSTLEVRNLVKDFRIRKGLRRSTLRAVNDALPLAPGDATPHDPRPLDRTELDEVI